MQDLSPLELAYCIAVLLFTFALRGSLGFGGAVGLPLLALVIPVKILAPAWSLVGIVSSAAIIGHDRQQVDRRAFLRLLPGCALGIAAGLFFFATLLTLSIARTVGYAAVNELTLDSFILCGAAIPAMGLGLLVGDKIHSGLSQAAFQRVVCAALSLCGVPLLLK